MSTQLQTATLASVAASTSSVTLFAANYGAAQQRVVQNDSTATLYLKYGATASTTSHTVQIPAGAYYEFPQPMYAGAVTAVWASATGSARTTEVA